MADLRDFTGKNRRFTGTDAETISSGTTGERVTGTAKLRFNTTLNLMEYYDGANWKSIDSPPVVTGLTLDDVGGSSVSSANVDNEASGNCTVEIIGSLFDATGALVTLEGTAETLQPVSLTRNSTTKLTATFTRSQFDVGNSPYAIKIENGSGLSASLGGALSADADAPVFTNAANTNFDIFDAGRASVTISAAQLVQASPVVSSSSAYAVSTGALPSGLALNGTTGVITGNTSATGSDAVTTFSVTATSTEGGTLARQFTITRKAPQITTFNANGTFTVPSGLSTVNVLLVAGGGGTGGRHAGGGGGGGLIYRPAHPITPGTPLAVTVGARGNNSNHQPGGDSVFSNLTAKGGGGGHDGSAGQPGGSGSGGGHSQKQGGSATQPSQSGDSGTYGFGHAGGNGHYTAPPTGAQGGGGGGAGAVGGNSGANQGADGGAGRAYSISGSSVYYAGGGAGGNHQNASDAGTGGQGGGGNRPPGGSGNQGQAGTTNRGGGAGGGNDGSGVYGGSGIVIVQY
jgi:hypothetical protein